MAEKAADTTGWTGLLYMWSLSVASSGFGFSSAAAAKNGFSIYRIDGFYEKDNQKINFELQIKALVHAFWGEIEHKLVYKNTNYYVYDSFMKDLLASINAQLTITDRQLSIVYQQMQELSLSDSGLLIVKWKWN